MVEDYSKTFDKMEWDFISNCLKLFNFGNTLISIVLLMQYNPFSKIEKWLFSDDIFLECSCRQGDPISPYLILLSAEILSTVIRNSKDVRRLRMGHKEVKNS